MHTHLASNIVGMQSRNIYCTLITGLGNGSGMDEAMQNEEGQTKFTLYLLCFFFLVGIFF